MKGLPIIAGALVVGLVAYGVWQFAGAGLADVAGEPGPNSAEGAPEGSIHNLPVPPAVAAVRAKVAAESGVATNQVLIETAFEKEWSDSCLGLGGPAESCAFVITPGWEVVATAKGETRTYRTNTDGSVIRVEPVK